IPEVEIVTVSDGVEIVSIAEGDDEGKPNPHAWMSPKQSLVYVENIKQALIDLSPKDADYFTNNATAYAEKLKIIDQEFAESLKDLSEEKKWLVTCEGAFSYLAKDYGLSEKYIWAVNDESDGSPKHISEIINELRPKEISTIFCE